MRTLWFALATFLWLFSSSASCSAIAKDWQSFKPTNGDFQVALPDKVQTLTESVKGRQIKIYASVDKAHRIYAVYPGGYCGGRVDMQEILVTGKKEFQTDGDFVSKPDTIRGKGWSGARFALKKPGANKTITWIVAKVDNYPILYTLRVSGIADAKADAKFISSFAVDPDAAWVCHGNPAKVFVKGEASKSSAAPAKDDNGFVPSMGRAFSLIFCWTGWSFLQRRRRTIATGLKRDEHLPVHRNVYSLTRKA